MLKPGEHLEEQHSLQGQLKQSRKETELVSAPLRIQALTSGSSFCLLPLCQAASQAPVTHTHLQGSLCFFVFFLLWGCPGEQGWEILRYIAPKHVIAVLHLLLLGDGAQVNARIRVVRPQCDHQPGAALRPWQLCLYPASPGAADTSPKYSHIQHSEDSAGRNTDPRPSLEGWWVEKLIKCPRCKAAHQDLRGKDTKSR